MTDQEEAPPTVAEVLGRTARELRGDRKVELVSRAARLAGLNWGTGRIADLEAGRVSPTLPTLFALCWAFGDLLDRPVSLADLFAGDGPVTLTPGVTISLAHLRAALTGQPLESPPIGLLLAREGVAVAGLELEASDIRAHRRRIAKDPNRRQILPNPRVQRVASSMLEADYRMAHSLGLDVDRAAEEMEALWGQSFTAKRDHRAGPDANPQKRGRISRELKAELQEAINRGDD
jgi:hypothetical protein